MKNRGRHPVNALTAAYVRSVKVPGKYSDGNGLYLIVDKNGGKRWMQRLVINSKRCDLGLGSVSLVSLAVAREKALENRKAARAGYDPLAARKVATAMPTFEQAARIVYENNLPTWRNPKHGPQWIGTLETYVFPFFGNKKVDQVTASDVLTALTPIWVAKHETASRVRQRISTTLKWAIAHGHRQDNPAEAVMQALPKPDKTPKRHKSLHYSEVASAIEKIKGCGASLAVKLGVELLILTASRSGEVRGAKWEEFDLDAKVWTVPASRMKAKKEHRVPLSDRCMEILEQAKSLIGPDGYVFPGSVAGKPLADATFSKLLREQGIDCVPHGFRSSFRVWASEQTNFPNQVCEFALAHVIKDKAEAAYQRSDLFDKRCKLMDAWASYILKSKSIVVSMPESLNCA